MEFLEILENIQSDLSTSRAIFNGEEGASVNSRRNIVRGRRDPIAYKKQLLEAVKFVEKIKTGKLHPSLFQEVMTTSDFPILFGDILDRTLLAKYETLEPGWAAYARRVVVNDFREAELIPPILGADAVLDVVPEADQYPDAGLEEQERTRWKVQKFGRRVPFSWETIINDNLGQLNDIPERLALAARRTEHRQVTSLFIGTSGPASSMYSNGNKNIVNTTNGASVDNPPLSILGLEDAMLVLSKMVDESGYPIVRSVITLVVPPALEIRAMNILNATEVETTQERLGGNPNTGTNGENRLRLRNWMSGSLRVVVDPYIPVLANSANGNTTWFLFAEPNTSREAIRIGFLRGHESPEIWMKSPNAVRVGGGDVGPMSGDFDTDSIEYRIRHVLGAVKVDPKATVASNGSGSS